MECKVEFDKEDFGRMEKEILEEVMSNSKSMIETFKFRMIYGLNMNKKINKTISGLKKFREKNWDSKLSRSEAYKKYLKLY